MSDMFMGTERVRLGDARHLHICHLSFLSELALSDFGVNFKQTRAYTADALRYRLYKLYAFVYSTVKGANWPIFLPKDFVLRVNFAR
jgi:hypothetical protein